MKLTKGKILKLYGKKNQSIKKKCKNKRNKKKSKRSRKTYKRKQYSRLEKKSLKRIYYGGNYDTVMREIEAKQKEIDELEDNDDPEAKNTLLEELNELYQKALEAIQKMNSEELFMLRQNDHDAPSQQEIAAKDADRQSVEVANGEYKQQIEQLKEQIEQLKEKNKEHNQKELSSAFSNMKFPTSTASEKKEELSALDQFAADKEKDPKTTLDDTDDTEDFLKQFEADKTADLTTTLDDTDGVEEAPV